MKVWIDQDLCTGDGLCEEIAPDVFVLLDDGLAYVREGDKVFAAAKGNPQGLRETKRLVGRPLVERIDEHGAELAALSARLFGSEEAKAAMLAFLNRKKR